MFQVHHNPALKLKTPIAYQKDTDIEAIPIMKEGIGQCLNRLIIWLLIWELYHIGFPQLLLAMQSNRLFLGKRWSVLFLNIYTISMHTYHLLPYCISPVTFAAIDIPNARNGSSILFLWPGIAQCLRCWWEKHTANANYAYTHSTVIQAYQRNYVVVYLWV